jgi:signal transduction histidine kinase
VGALSTLGIPLLVAVWTSSLASLGVRFRRAIGRERDQLKWFLYAGAVLAAVYLASLPLRGIDAVRPWVAGLVLIAGAFVPVSVGIAILKHRLYDIDRLISRTLAFGLLWLLITFGYVSLAAALGIMAGGRLPVEVAVVCTLGASLLFQPARRRLERLADRWVFGERLGGYELLTRFGATLEGAIEPCELGPCLAAMVRQGLDVQWVRVTARRASGEEGVLDPIGAAGIDPERLITPAMTAPLMRGEERIGVIDCGPKRDGAFSAKDQELLTSIGRQAALAIRNAALNAELSERLIHIERQAHELAASRTRLVQAEEAGRRRIERDIHDGVQQELVALLAKLRLARNQLGRSPEQAAATLAELQEDARQALEDLRELARGIHPPVLSDRGLLEAIEGRVARLPIEVRIEADGLARGARLPEAIEGAAYFLVCEGLANTLKYAAVQQASVRLASTPTSVHIEVVDDGRGFEPAAVACSGLRGLMDRIEAVGGSLRIVSRPGAGTRLCAELPLGEPGHA